MRSTVLVGVILAAALAAGCGPGAAPPATTAESVLTPSPAPKPTWVRPTASPMPSELSERLGHVQMRKGGTLAEYAYRAFLQVPVGVTWGPDGHLYIADRTGHHVVRVAPDSTMDDLPFWKTTPGLQSDGPRGVAFDSKGNLYLSNYRQIFRVGADGQATELTGIKADMIGSIAVSPTDELYYTDLAADGAVRKWLPSGSSDTVVGHLPQPNNLVSGRDGFLYLTQEGKTGVLRIAVSTGEISIFRTDVCSATGCFLAIDPEGDVWVRGASSLAQYAPEGSDKPFVVDGQNYPGGTIDWSSPAGIAFDSEGGLWIAARSSRLVRLVPATPGTPDPTFSRQVVYPGLEGTGLAMGPDGALYFANIGTHEVMRVIPGGAPEVMMQGLPEGETAIAVDRGGGTYLGLASGEVVKLNSDGTTSHYAQVRTRQMVFGVDGALYAVFGDRGQTKSIVRIAGIDSAATLATQIGGVPLGEGEIRIAPAPTGGLYVFSEVTRQLFSVDFGGQGGVVADLTSVHGTGTALLATSPLNGNIYLLPHGPYALFQIDPTKKNREMAMGLEGDPWGMAISADGNWLYVGESGAIDKISIAYTPR